MEIIKYTYRKGGYLTPLNLDNIDSIAIHHTGNDNDIKTNTDYHMNANSWAWLGYNYYIVNGVIYEIRGFKYKAAAVKHENHHVISIAVQGDYNSKIPSQKDIDALQWLCDYLKSEVPSINKIKGHKHWNQTSCPGRFFAVNKIKLNENNFITKQQHEEQIEKLNKEIEQIKSEQRQIKSILSVKLQIRIR